MRAAKTLAKSEMVERGVKALYQELGPLEARRFIALANEMPREDSVKRHRKWQDGLDEELFIKKVMAVQRA